MRKPFPYGLVCLGLLLIPLVYFWLWPWLPHMLMELQGWQKALTRYLGQLLTLANEHPMKALAYMSLASMSYGFLHAIGPGHGKVIMASYLSTHPTKIKTSLFISTWAAMLQALVAIVLVSALVFLLETSMREVNAKASYLVEASFIAMVLLGLYLAFKSVRDFIAQQASLKQQEAMPYQHETMDEKSDGHDEKHDHQHHHACGCGHKHHASPADIQDAKNLTDYIGIIFSIGIRPCSGALLMLIFAKSLGLYWMGIISVITMGVGTGAAIALLAYLSIKGGHWLARFIRPTQAKAHWRILALKLGAASFICLMGLIMMQGSASLFSPVL